MLGNGSLAVVYLAHDPEFDIDVAVKLLAEPDARNPEIRARFVAEAQALRQLSDDRVVTVYDIGDFEGRPFLAMEFVDGGTLDDLLRDGRTLSNAEIGWLVAGLGAAVVVVHAAGFVHRGITPSNILIRHAGTVDQVVLADFGLARDDQGRRTVPVGTDGYLAPEQRLPGVPVDGRADVYAASAVIGRAVFGTGWRQILVPSGLHQVTALEPPGTEPLAFELRRGLSANPADRHASISEWTDSVREATSDHAAVVETANEGAPRSRPMVRFVAAGLVVLAMVLAVATVTTQ